MQLRDSVSELQYRHHDKRQPGGCVCVRPCQGPPARCVAIMQLQDANSVLETCAKISVSLVDACAIVSPCAGCLSGPGQQSVRRAPVWPCFKPHPSYSGVSGTSTCGALTLVSSMQLGDVHGCVCVTGRVSNADEGYGAGAAWSLSAAGSDLSAHGSRSTLASPQCTNELGHSHMYASPL